MRRLLLAVLLSFPAQGAVVQVAGANNGINTVSVTAAGSNLVCLVMAYAIGGTVGATETCNGNTMTQVSGSPQTVLTITGVRLWIYSGALTAGTITAINSGSGTMAHTLMIYSGGAQSGQPDSVAAVATGTSDGASGGIFGLPFTVIAANSYAFGLFVCTGQSIGSSPSTNGTLQSPVNDANAFWFWGSTASVPSGAFTLNGKTGSGAPNTCSAWGLSIAPVAATFISNPTIISVGP